MAQPEQDDMNTFKTLIILQEQVKTLDKSVGNLEQTVDAITSAQGEHKDDSNREINQLKDDIQAIRYNMQIQKNSIDDLRNDYETHNSEHSSFWTQVVYSGIIPLAAIFITWVLSRFF